MGKFISEYNTCYEKNIYITNQNSSLLCSKTTVAISDMNNSLLLK